MKFDNSMALWTFKEKLWKPDALYEEGGYYLATERKINATLLWAICMSKDRKISMDATSGNVLKIENGDVVFSKRYVFFPWLNCEEKIPFKTIFRTLVDSGATL